MNKLEQDSLALFFNGNRLEPASRERNIVGFCSKCENELESLAYHRFENTWLVSACCQNKHMVLIQYDKDWNWQGDLELETSSETKSISDLPKEQLEAVFSPAELRTLKSYEEGKPYTRQNLYRARAKYEKFEKLFGVKINI